LKIGAPGAGGGEAAVLRGYFYPFFKID